MTYDLFHLTYEVAAGLQLTKRGTATSGSTTTIADTNERTEANDFWNLGTAWLLRNASSPGIAPEGEFSVISDFANTGGVITLRSAFSQVVASGDTYAVAYKYVPLEIMIEKINNAIVDFGTILTVDTTSITTASNQTEYTLPSAGKLKLRQVHIQNNLNDTNDNQWTELYNWEVVPSAAGSAGTLRLFEQPNTGYKLMLTYDAYHSALYQSTDQLSEHIPQEAVIFPAVRDCYQYRKERTGWSDWDEQIERWTQRVEFVRGRKTERYPAPPGRIVMARRDDGLRNYPGDRNPR